jgi:hypothetical protein
VTDRNSDEVLATVLLHKAKGDDLFSPFPADSSLTRAWLRLEPKERLRLRPDTITHFLRMLPGADGGPDPEGEDRYLAIMKASVS